MSTIDIVFALVYAAYAAAIFGVLYRFRRQPLYDPRVLFTMAASLWLFILHGYLTEFDGYLAAKPGFYHYDIRVLSSWALGLMLIGYLAFVGGATVGERLRIRRAPSFRDQSLLVWVCVGLFAVAVLNFSANVLLISGGNIFRYLSDIAIRRYQIEDSAGITAVGYVLGFVGVQVVSYVAGRAGLSKTRLILLSAAIGLMLIMRFSQGRIFQTLVLLGTCFTAYSMGVANRNGRPVPWPKQVYLLVLMAVMGISIYFMRIASALSYLGYSVSLDSVRTFGSSLVHFALQRGNVPNFPVVFAVIDKIPSQQDFFLGSTLFNWALFFIPKSILQADYLISLQIKELWYTDIEGGGLPPTAVGEWYANFGPAGVLVGMFLIGFIMGWLYKRATISDSPYASVLWANMVFSFVVIYPKTDLAQIPQFPMFVLGSLWVLMLILRSAIQGRDKLVLSTQFSVARPIG